MAGTPGDPAAAVKKTRERIGAVAVSPDGSRIAFQAMPKDDWEIFVIDRDGSNETRVTREIQHDVSPRFVTNTLLIAATGEPRHLRSSLYDLQTRRQHAPVPQQHGADHRAGVHLGAERGRPQVLITAERDGDTVSPERGIYLVSLDRKVTVPEVLARLDASLAAEKALRARGERMFRPDPRRREARPRRGVHVTHLRLREGAVRLRLEAHHEAGQQACRRVPLRHLPLVRLRTGVPVVRAARGARRQVGQRDRHAQGHREPRDRVRRQQPLRLERRRPGRRRRQFGHGGAAGGRARAGEAADARHQSSSRRSPARSRACSAAASSCGARRNAGCASSGRSTTT